MSYIRVILRGTLPGGENWSVSPSYNETTNVTGWNQETGQNAANAIAALQVGADLNNLASAAGPRSTVRVERRSDNGDLVGAAEAPWVGGNASSQVPTKPFQTSVVISLRTNLPGGSGRGRLYWPALGAAISTTTCRLSAPTASSVATSAKTFLDAIETALKEQLNPSPSLIDYHLTVVSPTKGIRTDVTRIEVGDVLDVQRRRRDKVPEVRSAVAYP